MITYINNQETKTQRTFTLLNQFVHNFKIICYSYMYIGIVSAWITSKRVQIMHLLSAEDDRFATTNTAAGALWSQWWRNGTTGRFWTPTFMPLDTRQKNVFDIKLLNDCWCKWVDAPDHTYITYPWITFFSRSWRRTPIDFSSFLLVWQQFTMNRGRLFCN